MRRLALTATMAAASILASAVLTLTAPPAAAALCLTIPGSGFGTYGDGCAGGGPPLPPPAAPAPPPPSAAPAPPPPNPADLARIAVTQLNLAMPTPQFSPAPSRELVHFPLWLWIPPGAWAAQTATTTVGPLSVTVAAVPFETTWDMGDEAVDAANRAAVGNPAPTSHVVCTTSGTPWPADSEVAYDSPSPDCGYTYQWWSGDSPGHVFTVTTTMRWHLSWIANNGQRGDLGVVERAARTNVAVAEAHGLNVDQDGRQ